MAEVLADLLTSAVVRIACHKLSSAIAEQANLARNFGDDLKDMKDYMESIAPVLMDAEKQSVKKESVRLFLKRLKYVAFDITDILDDYQDSAKLLGKLSYLTDGRKMMILANKMKNIKDELRKIRGHIMSFNFTPSIVATQDQQRYDKREDTSAVNEARIFGRDVEKKEIIDILSTGHRKDGTMVLPIYGLAGMGKTTLAKLVYNDTQFEKYYDHRVWVNVSKVIDLEKIGRSISSRLPTQGGETSTDTSQMIPKSLDDLLADKKILIVLDDIWKEDASELDKLKDMLHVGKKSSMVDVLVTTRSESIANKICTNETYKLQPVAHNVCWEIIKVYSEFENKSNKQKLLEIGLDIAKKCGGVPLAAQELGCKLLSENLGGWSEMNKNDMWEKQWEIIKERLQDHQYYYECETTSYVNESRIVGRHAEKKDIIDILSKSHRKNDGNMVLPIYGLAGIGKTTLAQLVYSDTQFKKYYDHQVWVYVSEVFDLKKIGRSIISELSTPVSEERLHSLQIICQRLADLLRDKKILIVLDDIWEDDTSKLEKLKDILHVDRKNSMVDVLVTTYSESIAKKICTNESYKLQPLAHNVCWEIIKRYSGFENKSNKHKLVEIGLDIAKKCGGVPLAAQELGYKLLSKDLDGWSEMNKTDIWSVLFLGDDYSQHNKILSTLKLSYERMLPMLRLCFSYCAIFPKGHDIYEDDLVQHWVALDFIKDHSDGKRYIHELLQISFLQHSKLSTISGENVMSYTMHDMVHELARAAISDELIVIDAARKDNISGQKFCRYALLINYDGQKKLSDLSPENVRTLLFSSSNKLSLRDSSFTFAKHLRILDFSECSGIHLPSSIGQLKQLKCLIAPELQDKSLPEAIAKLSKLQYLNLRGSSQISALPDSIGKLSCLIYLGLSGCSGMLRIPEHFGELKSLLHLDMSNCSGITGLPSSIGNLAKLQHLDLSRCCGVKEIPETLGDLNQLWYLNLSYCDSLTGLPNNIGSLYNLGYLDMKSNGQIKELPQSFQNLQNLVHLNLSDCCVKGLPEVLCGLTKLEHLNVSDFEIDAKFWKDLIDAMGKLTNLKYLNAAHIKCPSEFFGTLTNLEHLVLSCNYGREYLQKCIGKHKKLRTLDLSH